MIGHTNKQTKITILYIDKYLPQILIGELVKTLGMLLALIRHF